MAEDIVQTGARHVDEIRAINRDLTEKALHMRCLGYLSQAKARLLMQTIFEIDVSKKVLLHANQETERQYDMIAKQKVQLEQKTGELQRIQKDLESLVEQRTADLVLINKQIQGEIEERKHAEQALKKHRDHLEELVTERTNELHAVQDELLRKERLATLGQLTATVSHELRNPLGTLRNSLFNISAKVKGKKLGVDKALVRMERNISRCDNIISEMLDFTCAHALDLKSVAIDDWLAEVLREQTRPKNISLEQDLVAGVSLEIDTEYLRRAIINIFDNACQALQGLPETEKRAREISVRTAVEDRHLLITIADNGPGIAGDVLTHIFEPLYSTKGFGVGLGLPIVKQILEQHGGGVDISSEAGQGTQVVLKLLLKQKKEVEKK